MSRDSLLIRCGEILNQCVVSTLVGSFLVIMNGILTAQVIEMPLAEYNEMVKAFLLDRLNESFDKRIRVWCSKRRDFHFLGS